MRDVDNWNDKNILRIIYSINFSALKIEARSVIGDEKV